MKHDIQLQPVKHRRVARERRRKSALFQVRIEEIEGSTRNLTFNLRPYLTCTRRNFFPVFPGGTVKW
jgi:hypothetical protein